MAARRQTTSGFYSSVEELLEHHPIASDESPRAAYIGRKIAPRETTENLSASENFLCQAVLRTPPFLADDSNRAKLEKHLTTVLGYFWKHVPNARPILHITANAILAHENPETEEITYSFWKGQTFSKEFKEFFSDNKEEEPEAPTNDQDEYLLKHFLDGTGVPINSLSDLGKIPSLSPPEEILSPHLNKNFSDRGSNVYIFDITNIIFIIQSINLNPKLPIRKTFEIYLSE